MKTKDETVVTIALNMGCRFVAKVYKPERKPEISVWPVKLLEPLTKPRS